MSKKMQEELHTESSDKAIAKLMKVIEKMPEFKDEVDSASTDHLKKMVIQNEKNIMEIEKSKSEDSKLNTAKECVKEYNAPYAESLKAQKAKISYSMLVLESKGG